MGKGNNGGKTKGGKAEPKNRGGAQSSAKHDRNPGEVGSHCDAVAAKPEDGVLPEVWSFLARRLTEQAAGHAGSVESARKGANEAQ